MHRATDSYRCMVSSSFDFHHDNAGELIIDVSRHIIRRFLQCHRSLFVSWFRSPNNAAPESPCWVYNKENLLFWFSLSVIEQIWAAIHLDLGIMQSGRCDIQDVPSDLVHMFTSQAINGRFFTVAFATVVFYDAMLYMDEEASIAFSSSKPFDMNGTYFVTLILADTIFLGISVHISTAKRWPALEPETPTAACKLRLSCSK